MLTLREQEVEIDDLWRFLSVLFYDLKFVIFSCTIQNHWLWCNTSITKWLLKTCSPEDGSGWEYYPVSLLILRAPWWEEWKSEHHFITELKRYDFGYLQVALLLSIFHCHFQMCARFHPWLCHICTLPLIYIQKLIQQSCNGENKKNPSLPSFTLEAFIL